MIRLNNSISFFYHKIIIHLRLNKKYSPRIYVEMHAARNGIAHQIPTPVERNIRIASDAISRMKIIIVKTNCIMHRMRTSNLGNFDRQLVSCAEIFNDLLLSTGWTWTGGWLTGCMFVDDLYVDIR